MRRYFVSTYKWGPASFMKLTHFAYRNVRPSSCTFDHSFALSHIPIQFTPSLPSHSQALAKALRKSQSFGDGQNDAKDLEDFGKLLKGIVHLHNMHQRHEDEVLFPYYDSFFPGFCNDINEVGSWGKREGGGEGERWRKEKYKRDREKEQRDGERKGESRNLQRENLSFASTYLTSSVNTLLSSLFHPFSSSLPFSLSPHTGTRASSWEGGWVGGHGGWDKWGW